MSTQNIVIAFANGNFTAAADSAQDALNAWNAIPAANRKANLFHSGYDHIVQCKKVNGAWTVHSVEKGSATS